MRVQRAKVDELLNTSLARLTAGEKLGLTSSDPESAADLARAICVDQKGVWVRVPSGPDRLVATTFMIARGLGRLPWTAQRIRQGGVISAVEDIEHCLDGRALFVHGVGALHEPTLDELSSVYENEERALGALFRDHAAVTTGPFRALEGRSRLRADPDLVPLRLSNGHDQDLSEYWDTIDGDREHLSLIALDAILNAKLPDPADVAEKRTLRGRVWACLPRDIRLLLSILDAHDRPLPGRLLKTALRALGEISSDEARAAMKRAREWNLTAEEPGLGLTSVGVWSSLTLQAGGVARLHRVLGEAFSASFDLESAQIDGCADAVLEAQRHWIAAGDTQRAVGLSRYGAELLIGHARRLSLGAKRAANPGLFGQAAGLYSKVLELDDTAEREDIRLLGPRARAYATHYLHYNQARSDQVPNLPETERGFQRAVQPRMWPEHAVFHSRLALVQFYQGRRGPALATLRRADQQVPAHRDKTRKLRARTVDRLLRRGRVLEALHVWEDLHVESIAQGRDAQDALHDALTKGWQTRLLWVEGFSPSSVYFHEPVAIRMNIGKSRAVAILDALELTQRSGTPLEALTALIETVRAETGRLLRTLTPELGPAERMRKRTFLGMVDVVRSELTPATAMTAEVIGRIRWDITEAAYFLTAADGRGREYKVESTAFDGPFPSFSADELVAAQVRRAGPGGPVVGPVESIDRLADLDDEALDHALEKLLE